MVDGFTVSVFMKHLLLPLFFVGCAALPCRAQNDAPKPANAAVAAAPWAQRSVLALKSAKPNAASATQWEKFELTLDLSATYDNPFDPSDIDVWAIFTSPSGASIRVNGFLWADYARRLDGKNEIIEARGAPAWKIRFAPSAPGVWRYRVAARDRSGMEKLPETTLQVAVSPPNSLVESVADTNAFPDAGLHRGIVRRSAKNPRAFAFADEKPFVPIGENMGWAGNEGSFEFDRWLQSLGKAGGNWMRIWMSSWNCGLEWTPPREGSWQRGDYHGVGVYSLDNAWKLDTILDAAERNNIYTMVCLGTYGEFTEGGFFNEGQWKNNPYNAANGGPCAKPLDFWTNEGARSLYRRRLRYIAARYGWRTHVFAWEFWNEANAPAAWVGEMARFLKGAGEWKNAGPADPHGHLVSTTYGNDAVWKLPEIDFSMTHSYGDMGNIPDHAPVVAADAQDSAQWNKPHLMAEFGIDWRAGDEKYDPQGRAINFHNGLWSSMAAGNPGGAMLWWWDGYVHPQNLYGQLTPLRRFSDSVPWTAGAWKPLKLDPPTQVAGVETFSDLQIVANGVWGKAAQSDFVVAPSGVQGNLPITAFLYSPGKPEMRTTPLFHVNYERAGRFSIHVNTVSNSSTIQILLDGKVARELKLDAAPPVDPKVKPEYQSTELSKQWNVYQAIFNREYSVDVPAGRHAIQLQNIAGDWASLESVTLGNYRSSRFPAVNAYGVGQGGNAVLWIQNAAHNWKNDQAQKAVTPLHDLVLTIRDWPVGRYRVEWWDTTRGVISRTENVVAKNRVLELHIADLPSDVAVRIAP